LGGCVEAKAALFIDFHSNRIEVSHEGLIRIEVVPIRAIGASSQIS
jgi:hypothetical protein